jgi:glycogen operon protein
LSSPGIIDHLKRLGVTSIELLPVHAFVDDRQLVERGLRNYWGYNSIGFFAPEPRYTADGGIESFKTMVAHLHEAGIEVLLDVVYNHTAEGNHLGPTLSFRGIDNASYYWLLPDQPRYYDDFTGCGNALNLTHPRVLQMVMDSLRYWVEECHVDGFRFDLTSTLGRGQNGFDPRAPFFAAVRQDPVLSRVKLIAEPWDLGLGGYQVGAYPPEWSEWNDVYRRTLRSFWRGDAGQVGDLARRMTGSADIFHHRGRSARASINHVTVHDGFTLNDLVSYEKKHNAANKENNQDGTEDNISLNCGAEGATDDKEILKLRSTLIRNQLACLFLAQGVPLLLAGDEVGNSQAGNNNPYCQDNEVGWTDWSGLGEEGRDVTEFIAELVQLRQRFPQLKGKRWLGGRRPDGHFDVLWVNPKGTEMTRQDWQFAEGRYLSYVVSPTDQSEGALFVLLNAAPTPVEFVFPNWQDCKGWTLLLATVPLEGGEGGHAGAGHCTAPARSVTVFAEAH